MTERQIRRSRNQAQGAIADLLVIAFSGELLRPSKNLTLVSPYMSDFPVLDNRTGSFSSLDPAWPATMIPMTWILRTMLGRGSEVRLACQHGRRQDQFVRSLFEFAERDDTIGLLKVRQFDESEPLAHEKALIADRWALYGSMNFTYSGVELNGELVTLTTDPNRVAQLAIELGAVFKELA